MFGGLDSELRAAFGCTEESREWEQVRWHGGRLESQLAAGYNSMADSLGGMVNSASVESQGTPGRELELNKYKNMEKFLSSTLSQKEESSTADLQHCSTEHRYQNSDPAGFHSEAVDVRPYGLALYSFVPQYENELGFKKGDMIFLLQHVDSDWLEGELDCQRGIFPR